MTIEEEAERLSRFVTNLLEMTKVEAGVIDARRDWIEVSDAVRAAVERSRKLAPERKVVVELPSSLPQIRADASLLEQVLFNLLDNANKYSEPGSATRVAAVPGHDALVLTVTDAGAGIPADALEKVFDKFYRVAGSDGRAPGTGLGLSICAGLVKAMGGSITAESPAAAGRGTRIVISFPLEPNIERKPASKTEEP